MITDAKIIDQVRKRLEDQKIRSAGLPFHPTVEESSALSKLTREMEIKRQTSGLTEMEKNWLGQIDELLASISRFNSERKSQTRGGMNIYELGKNTLSPELQEKTPYVGVNISDDEANRIISGINKQFEEKVMTKVRERRSAEAMKAEAMQHGSSHTGRSLSEYLSDLRADLPDEFFSDEDSSADLSKLKRKHA